MSETFIGTDKLDNTPPPRQRIAIYDWLRLIATILVVVGHSTYFHIETVCGGVDYTIAATNSVYNTSILLRYLRIFAQWVYTFHMPLFFFLSGAVLHIKQIKDTVKFIISKVKRLLIPYYTYGLLFMIPVKYFSDFYSKKNIGFAIKGFLYGREAGHLWFLISLFFCMTIFALMLSLLKKFGFDNIWTIIIFALIVQCVGYFIPDVRFNTVNISGFFGINYTIFFALGYILDYSRDILISSQTRGIVTLFFMLTVVEMVDIKLGLIDTVAKTFLGLAWALMLALLCSKYLHNYEHTKIWSIIIRNLFNVYLFHDPLNYVILKITMQTDLLSSAFGCYLYFFLRTVGVFTVSVFLGETIRYASNRMKLLKSGG